MNRRHGLIVSAVVVAFVGVSMTAVVRTKPPKLDRIEVVGHATLSDGTVTQLLTAAHWRRNYLYVEFANAPAIVVFDVTAPETPALVGRMTTSDARVQLTDVVGSVALATESSAGHMVGEDRVTILSFADPARPSIVREFLHVTARLSDGLRDLVYLANDEGLWILKKRPGDDLEWLKEYDRYIMSNR